MAENIPPNGSSMDATRGIPYYEKLKKDLHNTIQRKRTIDKNMVFFSTNSRSRSNLTFFGLQETIEQQIYRCEAAYLEETGAGNIIKGFDNYIKGSSTVGNASSNTGGGTSTRRKGQITEADRVFSRSSASFMRVECPSQLLAYYMSSVPESILTQRLCIGAFPLIFSPDNTISRSHTDIRQSESTSLCKGK